VTPDARTGQSPTAPEQDLQVSLSALVEEVDMAVDGQVLGGAEDVDVDETSRTRARLLQRAGQPAAAAAAWIDASELAAAQSADEAARADLDCALAAIDLVAAAPLQLLERCARQATRLAHPQAAARWQLVAAAAEQLGESDRAARALHHAWHAPGSTQAGERLLERGASLGDGGWAARCESVVAFLAGRVDGAERASGAALQAARSAGDRELEALALHGLACARSVCGDLADAIHTQRQALAVAQAIGDPRTLDSGGVNLVVMLHDDLRGAEAAEALERLAAARGLAGETGPIHEAAAMRASLLHAAGDTTAALRALGCDAEDDACEPLAQAHVALVRAALLADIEDDDETVAKAFESLRAHGRTVGLDSLLTRAGMLHAQRLLERGDEHAACDQLQALAADAELEQDGLLAVELALPLARAALATGDVQALDVAGLLVAGCRCSCATTRIAVRELRAIRSWLRDGSSDELEQVADQWGRRGRPLEAGRVLLAAALGAAQATQRTTLAAAAAALLARCGAAGAARCATELEGTNEAGAPARLVPLEQLELLQGIDEDVRQELVAHAVDVRRKRGSVLHEPGGQPRSLLLVRSGSLRTCAPAGDRRLTLELLDAGAVACDEALLGEPMTTMLECETDVVVAAISIERVEAATMRCPVLARRLLQLAARRAQHARRQAGELAHRSVEERLARCLLELERRYGHATLDGHRIIERTFTHHQLADLVNARRETIGECLKTLRAAGIIDVRRRRIVLLRVDLIAERVGTEQLT
jgi:CRP-like cAMP-binding protein